MSFAQGRKKKNISATGKKCDEWCKVVVFFLELLFQRLPIRTSFNGQKCFPQKTFEKIVCILNCYEENLLFEMWTCSNTIRNSYDGGGRVDQHKHHWFPATPTEKTHAAYRPQNPFKFGAGFIRFSDKVVVVALWGPLWICSVELGVHEKVSLGTAVILPRYKWKGNLAVCGNGGPQFVNTPVFSTVRLLKNAGVNTISLNTRELFRPDYPSLHSTPHLLPPSLSGAKPWLVTPTQAGAQPRICRFCNTSTEWHLHRVGKFRFAAIKLG